jgi:hypothetical protein
VTIGPDVSPDLLGRIWKTRQTRTHTGCEPDSPG